MSDQIPLIPDVPPGLREAAHRGILIPFIGAGVSILAGCPGWAKFADGALRCLIDKDKFSYSQLDQISHLNPRVKLSLARALEKEHSIAIDFRTLLHPSERMEHEKGRRLYGSLFKLGKVFVTTNYDEWLDEEIPEPMLSPAAKLDPTQVSRHEPMNVIHKIDGLTLASLDQPNTVIHLHGSVRDSTKMILTTQDYVRHYANDRFTGEASKENPVLTFLEYLFNNRTVLFIGYGLEELEILEYVILKARRPPGSDPAEIKHYIIQGFFSHEEELKRSLELYYLKECGIKLLPFLRDQKDWDQLLEVLDEFARLIPVAEPLELQKRQDLENLLNG